MLNKLQNKRMEQASPANLPREQLCDTALSPRLQPAETPRQITSDLHRTPTKMTPYKETSAHKLQLSKTICVQKLLRIKTFSSEL